MYVCLIKKKYELGVKEYSPWMPLYYRPWLLFRYFTEMDEGDETRLMFYDVKNFLDRHNTHVVYSPPFTSTFTFTSPSTAFGATSNFVMRGLEGVVSNGVNPPYMPI